MTRSILITARSIAAALCLLGIIMFLASSVLGGFRIDLGFVVLSCRVAEKPLLLAVITGLILAWLDRKEGAPLETLPQRVSRPEWIAAGVTTLITLIFIWSRAGYLSYYRLLVRLNDYVYPPLWLNTIMHLVVGAGSAAIWLSLKKTSKPVASIVTLALFSISHLAFYLGKNITLAYGLMISSWILLNWRLKKPLTIQRHWLLIAGMASLTIILLVTYYGPGWSLERLYHHWNSRFAVMPVFWVVTATGCIQALKQKGAIDGLQGAAALALAAGLPLAGTPGELGDSGAVFLVPIIVVLAAEGAQLIANNRFTARSPALRNVCIIAIIGMVIGTARLNLAKTVCPPGYRYQTLQTDQTTD